jgi:hypothetical protein
MRLINVRTLKLEDVGSRTEKYAILSHCWGPEEVSLEEFEAGTESKKAGYDKILKTCRQTKADGFDYVWIDTCCIDKRNNSELSESINSMFRWYQDAVVCYAYVEDVPVLKSFKKSRWFSRGWTLQELLAPAVVRFYDFKWEFLGTREGLADQISLVTLIDERALQGPEALRYVRSASVAQRMAWAADRETTKSEDLAYCLLGLFDVNMPLLYGEGGTKAFIRLQEEIMKRNLDQSFLTWTAASSDTCDDVQLLAGHPRCFKGCTRVAVTAENVAPFSLNNQGLQLRAPVFQLQGRRNHFVIVLACVLDGTGHRIGIHVRAVERTGTTLIRQVATKPREVSEAEFREARIRDICLLRTGLKPNRRILWVRNDSRGEYPLSIKTEFLSYSAPSPRALYELGDNMIEMSEPRVGSTQSYGVSFSGPQVSQETTNGMGLERALSKILARVDVDVSVPYSATVSIDKFQDGDGENNTKNSHTSAARYAAVKLNRVARAFDPKNRGLLRRTFPFSRGRRQPDTLSASLSWQRTSGQDYLVLSIHVFDSTLEPLVKFREQMVMFLTIIVYFFAVCACIIGALSGAMPLRDVKIPGSWDHQLLKYAGILIAPIYLSGSVGALWAYSLHSSFVRKHRVFVYFCATYTILPLFMHFMVSLRYWLQGFAEPPWGQTMILLITWFTFVNASVLLEPLEKWMSTHTQIVSLWLVFFI